MPAHRATGPVFLWVLCMVQQKIYNLIGEKQEGEFPPWLRINSRKYVGV